MSAAAVDLSLLALPLLTGLLVLATHVPLGIEVLRRGIIFIDLAVAQVAALGAIAAGLAHGQAAWAVQLSASAAALAAAALLTWCERRWPDIQEALIGLLFVCAAAAGIVLLAGHPQGGEHLRDTLAGQILWVGWQQLAPVAAVYAVVLALCWRWRHQWAARRLGFYAVFAVTVTAAVQLVGVLLVFASLIAPAVATVGVAGARRRLALAWLLGTAAYGGGLWLSLRHDWPAGAAVVLTLGLAAVLGLAAWRSR